MPFEPLPLRKPLNRLRRAAKAATSLAVTRSYREFEDLWEQFLNDSNAFFDQMHVITKPNARTSSWYGAKHAERRRDPLLKYIWEARNSNEHSVADVTHFVQGNRLIGIPGPGQSNAISISGIIGGPDENFRVTPLDGLPVHSIIEPSHAVLLPVKSRDGRIYEPPQSHLSVQLQDVSPGSVASLAVAYMERLIVEASKLRI